MQIASLLTFTLIVLVSTVRMDTFTNSMGLEKFVEFYGHLQATGIENNGLTAQQMFSKHDINQDAQLDTQELRSVLVSHFASSPVPVSDAADHDHEHSHGTCEPPSSSEAWGYGILASVIISVISIVGAAAIPLSSRGRGYVLEILISFAVGALVGDAVLHLLPEVLGVHSHAEEEEEEAEEEDKSYLWPLLLVLVAILFFYAVERLINYLHNTLSGSDHHHHHTHSHGLAHPPDHEAKVHHAELRESISSTELITVPVSKAPEAGIPEKKFQSTKEQLQAVKAIGWLNLISDAFHNFTDGLAIGAAFSTSTKLGLGTAIAVGFHEIPQELGDFALLLHSGFTFTQCILFNLASACFAILGTIIGLGIGEETSTASKWILSFTAGGFLYIALADMMPELHHKTGKVHMLVQMIGMVVGMVVLLIIAIFETETAC